jgi:hypothetical protein
MVEFVLASCWDVEGGIIRWWAVEAATTTPEDSPRIDALRRCCSSEFDGSSGARHDSERAVVGGHPATPRGQGIRFPRGGSLAVVTRAAHIPCAVASRHHSPPPVAAPA